MTPGTIKHVLAVAALTVLAVGAFSVPLRAREDLNLVGLNTPAQDHAGKRMWIATFFVSVVASATAGWLFSPLRVALYGAASLLALVAGVIVLLNVSDFGGTFLAVAACVFGEFTGAAGARSAQLQSKPKIRIALWTLPAAASAALLFVLTWALAFFE